MCRSWHLVLFMAVVACSEATTEPEEPLPAEVGCQPGEITLEDGSCRGAGVPEDGCGEGFAWAAEGCSAILPTEPCGAGLVALPGETSCRPLMDCGADPWGDVQPEATAQFVDQAYGGGDSDGTANKPWTSIQSAIDAADAGAMVIIAAGDYAEDLAIDKPVRLHGRCPDRVSVVGSATALAAVAVGAGATGAEIRGIAVQGPSIGIAVSGSEAVRIERVWIHDTGNRGINAQPNLGATGLIVQDVLIESARRYGIFSVSAAAEIDRLLVRGTSIDASTGRGIGGIFGLFDEPRPVAIRRSAFIGNHAGGLHLEGVEGSVESVLVRDTWPAADGTEGFGLVVGFVDGVGATVNVNASVIERSHDQGLYVGAAEATAHATTVRDVFPQPQTGFFGRGVNAEAGLAGEPAKIMMTSSIVERAFDVGVLTIGAPASLESVLVRDVASSDTDPNGGIGISVQFDQAFPSLQAKGDVRGCVVERAAYAGVIGNNANLTVASTLVRDTRAYLDGTFGDGFAIVSVGGLEATATVVDSRIEGSARAGVAAWSASASLTNVMLACNTIDLDGESVDERPFSFEDLGGNSCGCPPAAGCKAQTSNLRPPSAL